MFPGSTYDSPTPMEVTASTVSAANSLSNRVWSTTLIDLEKLPPAEQLYVLQVLVERFNTAIDAIENEVQGGE